MSWADIASGEGFEDVYAMALQSARWEEPKMLAEAEWSKEQRQAILEAAERLETRFSRDDYHPDEDLFPVGWLAAAKELRYLATGREEER